MASFFASPFKDSTNCSLASSAERLDITSNCCTCFYAILSTSSCLFSSTSSLDRSLLFYFLRLRLVFLVLDTSLDI